MTWRGRTRRWTGRFVHLPSLGRGHVLYYPSTPFQATKGSFACYDWQDAELGHRDTLRREASPIPQGRLLAEELVIAEALSDPGRSIIVGPN